MRWRSLAVVVSVFLSVLAARARADPPAEDRAMADALFQEGRALVREGKYAAACPKLEACRDLDPTAGTLLALADCYELNGQTASAWSTFNQAEAMARRVNDQPRVDEAVRRIRLLEPRLSKLLIELDPQSSGQPLTVRRNGKSLDPGLLGSAIPVDPGAQTIEATAPGKQTWRRSVHIDATPGLSTVRIPPLVDAPQPPAPAIKPAPARPLLQVRPPDPDKRPVTARRTATYVVGGIGIAGLTLGGVVGALALGKKGSVNENCGRAIGASDDRVCNDTGVAASQAVRTLGWVSTIGFGVGLAGVGTAAVLFLTEPQPAMPAKKAAGIPTGVGVLSVGPDAAWIGTRWAW